jgi:pimeloyl-ACP methyl ester carboxylesterase
MGRALIEWIAVLSFLFLALGCGGARTQVIDGEWAGGFRLGADWTFARAHFADSKGDTVDLPYAYAAGLPVSGLVAAGGSVRFEVAAGSGPLVFEGRLLESGARKGCTATLRIAGEVSRGNERGPFELHRLRTLDAATLAGYSGAYQIEPDHLAYIQPWDELGGDHPVWFDESGEVRSLYPVAQDEFIVGPGAALPAPAEARVTFTRGPQGEIDGLVRRPIASSGDAAAAGTPTAGQEAKRVRPWSEAEVAFKNGDVTLAGTLLMPPGAGRHPALVLVHGSGPQGRGGLLPFVNFLVRGGIALLAYDKRGVGGSTGDWRRSGFEDLASDALAAVEFLKSRADIAPARIGLFGASQGGWVGPLAASRSRDVAFVVSVSGPGTTPAEQMLDHLENELRAEGVNEPGIAEALAFARLTHDYARHGTGWERVEAAVREAQEKEWFFPDMAPPKDHWAYGLWRLVFDYDPRPALGKVRCPVLALFGGRDLTVPGPKNRAIWEAALKASGNRDYTLKTFPTGNHMLWEAKLGTLRELPRLKGFVPVYAQTVREWVLERVR